MLKQLVTIVLLLILFTSCKSTASAINSSKENISKSDKKKTERLIDQMVETANENIGIKYKTAGTTKAGFDCSGLIYNVFNTYNIILPHNSYQQSKLGTVINLAREEAKKGDLIFFKTNSNSQINHVGLVIDVIDDEIKFIHASTSKGVIISSTKEPYYKRTYVQLNRVL